jgi:hypothetical protein
MLRKMNQIRVIDVHIACAKVAGDHRLASLAAGAANGCQLA